MSDANRIELQWLSGEDWVVYITTGKLSGKYKTRYLHLEETLYVSRYQTVKQGATMAYMDNSGYSAFPHLHFSLHDRDQLFGSQPYASIAIPHFDGRTFGDGDCVCSTNVLDPGGLIH
jgi:murein DD-endopeptidase MepM/ murein hydrolase activator NlpD